tara:strand:+ start:14194 stop:14601 length:408 start_codon:yes stop_codon:yes gene_type:complete
MTKKPITKLKKELDTWYSLYIRTKDIDNKGWTECYTCGKRDHYKRLQNGHFISRKHLSTRFLDDNCKVQCAGCNVFKYGNIYLYTKRLGPELSEELYLKSKETLKIMRHEYIDKITYYKSIVNKKLSKLSNGLDF